MQGLVVVSSVNNIVGFFYEKEAKISSYFKLRKANNRLHDENSSLRNKLAVSLATDTFKTVTATIPEFNFDIKTTSGDSAGIGRLTTMNIQSAQPVEIVRYAKYHYIPARVINNSVSNDHINFITINRGSTAGIEPGMAVVGSRGVVGRVEKVSEHFSTIASVLSNRKVSGRLRYPGSFGPVSWQPGNPDYVQMDNVQLTLPIKVNDQVFTTGYSYFPSNVLIGQVSRIDTATSSNSLTLQVRLSTNFRDLNFVYVVGNDLGKEREKLENQR